MTEKEYKIKFKEIVNWAEKETDKINKKIETIGLDTNKEKYKKIHQEYEEKIRKLNKEFKNSTY